MYLWPELDDETVTTFVTTGESAADLERYADGQPYNMRISYAVEAGADRTYVLHWQGKAEKKFGMRMTGLEEGEEVVFGLCLPLGAAAETETEKLVTLGEGVEIREAGSLAELSEWLCRGWSILQ